MPLKQKDSGAFTIPCVIGNSGFKRALCNLGASISVMPKHVYKSLSLETLNKTSIVIQLADRSFVYPLGVIEDVLVKIDSLVIPCDFYILDMECDSCDSSNNTPILLSHVPRAASDGDFLFVYLIGSLESPPSIMATRKPKLVFQRF